MATKKAPAKKKPVVKAASTKKVAPKKALAKAVAKKVPAKKRAAKAAATKKKHPLARLLEIHKKGSITKKGLIISIAVVVVAVLGYGGYTIYQNMSANAGGAASLGRGWTTVGSIRIAYNNAAGKPTLAVVANGGVCKVKVSGGYKIKSRVVVVSGGTKMYYGDSFAGGQYQGNPTNQGYATNGAVFTSGLTSTYKSQNSTVTAGMDINTNGAKAGQHTVNYGPTASEGMGKFIKISSVTSCS
jgi:hypothetical protein